MAQRPDIFTLNASHPLAIGAGVLGLGAHPGSVRYQDSSAFGNAFSLVNSEPSSDWVQDGTLNRMCTVFDGTGSNEAALCLTYRGDDPTFVTIAMWVKPVSVTTVSYLSCGNNPSGPVRNIRSVIVGYQSGYFNIYDHAYPTGTAADTQMAATAGAWQHIAYASNGSRVFGWKNGIRVVDVAGDLSQGAGVASIVAIGAGYDSGALVAHTACSIADYVRLARCCTDPEIQILANPSDPMLGGLINYPRRRLWGLAVAGGGATALTVQDSECVVASDTVSLTQHHVLSVGDAECVVESDAATLTQHHVLIVADSACLTESDNVALTQHHVLTVADSECVVESDTVALTQHHILTVADSACVVESDNVTLTYYPTGSLAVQDAECVVESDTVTLTQHHVMVVGDTESVVESDTVTLTAHNSLALVVQDSECEVTSDLVVLTQHHLLAVFNTEIVVTSDTVTLGGTYSAIVHYHAIEGPSRKTRTLEGPSRKTRTLEGPSKQIITLLGP